MKNVGSERPTNSKEFTENYSAMKKAIEKVDSLAKRLIAGGSENSKARHVKRGKMLPRDRVANLLDIGSFFFSPILKAALGVEGVRMASTFLNVLSKSSFIF